MHCCFRRRFTARIAGRTQDAADDGFAARQLGLHFVDFLLQFELFGERRHPPPIAKNHRQRRQRRAQFVRCAGRQQPHAHDVVFFGRALTQIGQTRIARAQNSADTGDEHHQQHRIEQKAQQQSLHIRVGQRARGVDRNHHRAGKHDQTDEAQTRRYHHHPT